MKTSCTRSTFTCSKKREAENLQHRVWRTLRRPFRYPSCEVCVWESYDFSMAGCRKCGACHACSLSSVDNACPLVVCEDGSRVCLITGCVVNEVRSGANEFVDTVDLRAASAPVFCLDDEVLSVVNRLLLSHHADRYRREENTRQAKKLCCTMKKALKLSKRSQYAPNMCQVLAECLGQEKGMRFVLPPSVGLVGECAKQIWLCLADLHAKGVHVSSGNRLTNLVTGLLYLLRSGLVYKNQVLLAAVDEVANCLPFENKLWEYFGISSKVICETENEIKLVFREHLQGLGHA